MTKQNIIALQEQLTRLGFDHRTDEIYQNRNNPQNEFFIVTSSEIKNDSLMYFLRFERNQSNDFRLKEYELTVRNISIPDEFAAFEVRMKQADEITNAYYSGNEKAGDQELYAAVQKDLMELYETNREAAQLFMFKYWPENLYKEFITDDSSYKQMYESTLVVDVVGGQELTATEAYKQLKAMNREHVISDELLANAKKELAEGNHYIAYNTINYFLDKPDMYFFRHKDEANEFSDNNISEYDNYKVIRAQSVDELLKQIPYGQKLEQQLFNSINLSTMNEKNYDYLVNQLKYTGFGEDLNQQLKEKIQKQVPEFTLTFQKDYGKDETVATLQFRKSDESDMYFFNRYNLMLKNEQHPEAIKQTFFIGKDDANITLKEAYNLMCGRAVYKEGLINKEKQEYKAWLQIDFKQADKNGNFKLHPYNENYGFDLEKALKVHTIKDMNDPQQKERLMESLERGNKQSVTITLNGNDKKLFIEAAPRFKSLNIYDESGKRLKPEDLHQKNSADQSEKQDNKKLNQKQGGGDDDDGGGMEQGPKKSKRRKQSIT